MDEAEEATEEEGGEGGVSFPTPWERTQKQRSIRSEKEGARLSGGRVQPASGAKRNRPGDFLTRMFLIEDKFTDAESFTIKKEMLDKTVAEAVRSAPSHLPQWRISLPGYKLRVLREEDYLALEIALSELEN